MNKKFLVIGNPIEHSLSPKHYKNSGTQEFGPSKTL